MTCTATIVVLALLTSTAAFAADDRYGGVVVGKSLACSFRDDAVQLITGVSEFASFLSHLEASGRCVWWHKGDKVVISDTDFFPVVIARQVDSSKYFFVDPCSIESIRRWSSSDMCLPADFRATRPPVEECPC